MVFKNTLVLDFETSGLSVWKDRIVQIGLIYNGKEKSILLNPTIPIQKEASDVHGITDEMIKDCPTFKDISIKLLNIINKSDVIIGFNHKRFDLRMLYYEFKRCNIELPNKPVIDVLEVYNKMHRRRLTDLYKLYTGEELKNAHDGLEDCKATQILLDKLKEEYKNR